MASLKQAIEGLVHLQALFPSAANLPEQSLAICSLFVFSLQDSFIIGIRAMLFFIPLILVAIALWNAKNYKLDNRILKNLTGHLTYTRGELKESPITEAELKELHEII